jgi:hypothetical protein
MKDQSILKYAGIIFAAPLAISGAGLAHAADRGAIREACAEDHKSLCPTVQPGGGRIIACLKENAGKLSPGCQKALESAKASQ